ncbi:right-handed parallel beta-helix repeat-containing protein [Pontiellaceae bacterium B12227]|nr:right-handed parallel beta-helix repeat-containing protein [Pontiellaceae bacterium B12227]
MFKPEKAVEKYRAVTNHDNSLKRLAFPVFGFEDFTIDGNGSTFMFHGRICPVTLEGCKGVTLKNFSIDWDTPFHHELRVVESDPDKNSFIAEIFPMKYGFEIKDEQLILNHYNWQNPIGQNVAFDSKTQAPVYMTRNYGLSQKKKKGKVLKVGENRVLMEKTTKVAPPVGTVLTAYGPSPGFNRLAQAIHASNSSDIHIENVTVYAAAGMALIAERCDTISLDGFVVTSTEERSLATRADATHFLGCKGLIRMENCRLEHMADDGINVHGAYIKVEEYKGNHTFLCAISHTQQKGLIFCEPGDRIMITSRETVLPIFETTVKAVKILDEEFLEITVAEIPDPMPKGLLSMENLTWYPDVIMKNNIIRNNRARSALITTKGDVLIEGNYFSSQMHGILIEGDNKSWYESGGVRNVVINNNVFENIGYGSGAGYPLYAAPLFLPEQRLGDDQYHWNVRFTNNKLKSFNGLLAHAMSVKGLVISGNTIELSRDYPTGSGLPSVELDFCKDSIIENNTFTGFDWPIRIEQKDNCSNVSVKKNKGIK